MRLALTVRYVLPTGIQSSITSATTFNTLNLTGAEGVTMTGSGSLTLAAGGLIGNTSGAVSGGTLQGSAGDDLIVITPANLVVSSIIADNGGATGLTKAGSAMLTLTSSNTYTGPTVIGAGSLQLSGTGALGCGPVTDNGVLIFNLSGSTTFGGSIVGMGGLAQAAPNVLTLVGGNMYTGGTTISAGTLQVGNGGSGEFLASASVNVASSAALIFNHADTLAYSGSITGGGTVTQIGASVFTLTGSNTYTAPQSSPRAPFRWATEAAASSWPAQPSASATAPPWSSTMPTRWSTRARLPATAVWCKPGREFSH